MRLSTSSSDAIKIVNRSFLALGIFICLNVLLFIPLNYMYFQSFDGNSGAQINNVLKTSSDIFIFGASRASHHYNTEIIRSTTQQSAFNAGDDGKNAVYQLGLLKLLLPKHVPKTIIYEVGDLTPLLDGGTVDLFPYYYYDVNIRKLLNGRDVWSPVKFAFPLYPYNRKVMTVSKGYILHAKPFLSGYRPLYGYIHPAEVNRVKKQMALVDTRHISEHVDQYAFKCFQEFISLCLNYKINLILVYSPSFKPEDPTSEESIEDIAHNTGIKYIDYGRNATFNWNQSYFKDVGHLNDIGAEMFTRDLIKYINAQ